MSGLVEAGTAATSEAAQRTPRSRTWRRLLRQPVAVAAGVVLAAVFVLGAITPRIAPDPQAINLSERWRNHHPMLSGWHLFGTDNLGRDLLTRTLYGLHASEKSALLATLVATVVGIALGSIAGYRGGWSDALIMRLGDLLGVLPAILLLLIAATYVFPITIEKLGLVIALYLWIPVARVVRAEVASLRAREFVQAALSLGASDRRVYFRHLLPNASSTIIVAATSVLGQVIILEATLEFFGVGVNSSIQATLGNLIGDAQIGSLSSFGLGWWNLAAPAGTLVLILVCVNLVGDGLADALRPAKQR